MRREWLCALLPLLVGSLAAEQQPAAPAPQPPPNVAYYAGPGVTAPELLPPDATIAESIAPIKHCKKIDGTSVLSAIVDSDGRPHEVYFLHPIGSDLDIMAFNLAEIDRFKPGTHDGAPAAMVVSIQINLAGCIVKSTNDSGQTNYVLKLRSLPVQQLDLQEPPFKDATLTLGSVPQRTGNLRDGLYRIDGVTGPVPLTTPEAKYSDYGRKKKIQGICIVGLIVDLHGIPQNVHIVKSLEPSLDQEAVDAVNHYRFKPAMKDGHPVPVAINIEVNFKLY